LASCYQYKYDHRIIARGWNSPYPFQLWRIFDYFNYDGHGFADEYKHAALYVSVREVS